MQDRKVSSTFANTNNCYILVDSICCCYLELSYTKCKVSVQLPKDYYSVKVAMFICEWCVFEVNNILIFFLQIFNEE